MCRAWVNGTWPRMQFGFMTVVPAAAWLFVSSLVFNASAPVTIYVLGKYFYPMHICIGFWWAAFGLFAVMAASYMSGVIHRLLTERVK